jgi:beta-mannanase
LRRSKLLKASSVLTALFAGAGAAALAPAAAAQAGPAQAGPARAGTVTVQAGPGATAPAGTRQFQIKAADDSYISSGRKAAGFGAQDKLVAGVLKRDVKTAYLKFTVPSGTPVAGARLTLTTVGAQSGSVTLRRVADNAWTEAGLTAATAPAVGAALASATASPARAALGFDLGAEVTKPGTYSFALTSTGPALRFRSAESPAGGPLLTVGTDGTDTPPAVPVTRPTAPAAPQGDCVTGALLVPSCGVLWGGAAGGFTTAPRDQELLGWEKTSGRTATIFHTYHKGNELFPTKAEIAMTADAAHPRVLLLNWKIAYGSTWANVARGAEDKRIDAFAARAKAYGKRFFLVLNHEPENDVEAGAGSGMTAKDFAAMYRHTILRLRAAGVSNVVNVLAYMGNEKWMAQGWWQDLYPGDDVVDWIGLDSYVSVDAPYHKGLFADLLDRAAPGGPGFYAWATTRHPGKPMMVAEWGAYHSIGHTVNKAAVYDSVLPELARRPAVKAIVHFDTKHDDTGDRDISIDSTATGLAAFRRLAASPLFDVKLG